LGDYRPSLCRSRRKARDIGKDKFPSLGYRRDSTICCFPLNRGKDNGIFMNGESDNKFDGSTETHQDDLQATENEGNDLRSNEKSDNDSSINEKIQKSIQLGYSKGYKAALKKLSSEREDNENYSFDSKNNQKSHPNYSQEDIKKMVAEEARALYEYQTKEKEVVGKIESLAKKIEKSKEGKSDFDSVVGKADFVNNYPDILLASDYVDNAGDVLYHLAKNPLLLPQIRGLDGVMQQEALKHISESLKKNNITAPESPLSSIPDSVSHPEDKKSDDFSSYLEKYRV